MEDNCRCWKCCFKKYWVAGLVLGIIVGAVNSFVNIVTNYFLNFQSHIPLIYFGIIMLIIGIILFITVPWAFGRLVKWNYETFKL